VVPAVKRVEVAAAVMVNDRGEFLLAQRPQGKVYAGYWEFPGGKVERGESAAAALKRELHEELGVEVEKAYSWLTREFDYAHAAVTLRFFRVIAWRGTLHGREQQQFAWQSIRDVNVAPILPANGPILRALELPSIYGISCAAQIGRDAFMQKLESALAAGLRLVQLREKNLEEPEFVELARNVVAVAHRFKARVLVNAPVHVAKMAGADGIHLSSAALMGCARRPEVEWCAASCHNAVELQHARVIGVDFVVLGSVSPTASHPGGKTLGWEKFAALIGDCPLPVYALGGMTPADLQPAWQNGAHGIAMLRGAWNL
jgi:8-oxo-dGTP diphosphatase